jgi:hypothetical protein
MFYGDVAVIGPGATSQALLTGTARLAQRTILVLLTELGSCIYNLTYGTSFLTDLRNRNFNSETDVFSVFAAALPDLTRNMQQNQPSNADNSELFFSASITNIILTPGNLVLTIQVTSQATTVASSTIPISLSLG